MSDPSIYTIGWICAIVPEFVAARLFLDEVHEEPRSLSRNDNNSYKLGRMGKHNVAIAVLPHGEYGESSAAVVARDMVRTFVNIRVGLMVGIGGGAPSPRNDVRLGDIVVSSPAEGYGGVIQYDFGKSIEDGKFEMTGFLNQPPLALRTALNMLISDLEIEGSSLEEHILKRLKNDILKKKYGRPSSNSDKLFRSDIVYDTNRSMADYCADDFVDRPERDPGSEPVVHYGLIASANQVMKDAQKRDALAKEKNVLCFEMEAAGLMNHFPCLVIRGICDYSDSHKNKQWQGYAAMAAASFAKSLVCCIPRQSLEHEQSVAKVLSSINSVKEDVIAIKDTIDHDILDKLPMAQGAEFDSYENQHEPRCHPSTRVDILRDIETWAPHATGPKLYWLSGLAGTGKSIIARTIAHEFYETNILGATFFFKRGEVDRGSASLFFGTLARQLAQRRPELSPYIVKAIKETDNICSKSMEEQFTKLVFNPLKLAASKPGEPKKLILVLDALDECSNEKDVEILLRLLIKAVCFDGCGLKLLITSRPEVAVRDACGSPNQGLYREVRLHDTPNEIVSKDISLYLRHQLTEIRNLWNARCINNQKLQLDWPGQEKIKALVDITIPLFLFAAIACRFIRDELFGSPEEQLLKLVQTVQKGGVSDKLQETYQPVLRQFRGERTSSERMILLGRFKEVIGAIILLEQPLSVTSIASLLGLKPSQVGGILVPLRSVLDLPSEEGLEVKLFHSSFRDFLLSPVAGDFSINFKETHWRMALACLEILSRSLRYNICSLKPADRRSAIARDVLEQQLPPHTRYACRFWFHHLKSAGQPLEDEDQVHKFLQDRFLYWVEALCVLGETNRAIQMIDTLIPLVKQPKIKLYNLLEDSEMLISKYTSVILEYPLQLYWSALVFSPKTSSIRHASIKSIPKCITFQRPQKSGWTPLIQNTGLGDAYEGYYAVVVSPDSRLVALSGLRGDISVWSLSLGVLMTSFRMPRLHSIGPYVPVAFFKDSKRIASALQNLIHVYVAETGEELCSFRIPDGVDVVQLDVSHTSEKIAASYDNFTAAIWTMSTGRRIKLRPIDRVQRRGSSRSVSQGGSFVSFSPNSEIVATSSIRGSVHLWEALTGNCLQTFETNGPVVSQLAFVSDTNLLIVKEADGEIRTLNIDTGCWNSRVPGGENTRGPTAISHDSRLIAHQSLSDSDAISISSFDTGEHYQSLHLTSILAASPFSFHSLRPKHWVAAFSPDGKFLIVAQSNGVAIWSLSMIRKPRTLDSGMNQPIQPMSAVTKSCFIHRRASEETAQIISMDKIDDSNEVNIWSSDTGELDLKVKNDGDIWDSGNATLSPDSKWMFLPCQPAIHNIQDSTVVHVMKPPCPRNPSWLDYNEARKSEVLFSEDSQSFAFGAYHDFSLWKMHGGLQYRDSTCAGTLITITPDWKYAVYTIEIPCLEALKKNGEPRSDEMSHRVRYLSIDTHKYVDMPEEADDFSFLAISPDSKWVASVPNRGKELSLWLASKCSRQALFEPESRITAVAFSSNSESVASADKAQNIRIWSTISGHCTNVLNVGRSLFGLSFSPDDSQLRTSFGAIAIETSIRPPQVANSTTDDAELENTSVMLQRPRWQGYGIDVSGKWITWDGVNLMLMPTDINPASNLNSPRWDYDDRRCQVAAGESVVAWVGPSGELYTMGFSRDMKPFD
ncbi:pfs domain-containing protein [Colletotrichum tamarilloi]|uniref:Pfs domain-containing protein n=1 Tax=Colletotrichum tamarilloi TaxID=1209934 RepID=A0ABQ9QXX8_9PEZI|nr:pfs domain-containing protein [Colletotrichum tamarilloi]KAK1488981.1 pfs domain-containing protein [Colletotrichum tamarilloi]